MGLSININQTALDIYHSLKVNHAGNFFFSPLSISMALALAYAGARGETQAQMEDALNITLPPDQYHISFRQLIESLYEIDENGYIGGGSEFKLTFANGIWAQKGPGFNKDFLNTLAICYHTELVQRDFINFPEKARKEVNHWVSSKTGDKIQNLIPPGGISDLTRIVLANAIYFYGSWAYPFLINDTREKDFTNPDGKKTKIPMMKIIEHLPYYESLGFQAVSIPYIGSRFSMMILLPDMKRFSTFEEGLDAKFINKIYARMKRKKTHLTMPKYELDTSFSLKNTLVSLGLTGIFSTGADFSGITDGEKFFIHDIFHKAFVAVDEKGTEAAAATAVPTAAAYGGVKIPERIYRFNADHPFIYLVYDGVTGSILFMGRMLDPRS